MTQVAIPSHGRADTISERTLSVLWEKHVPVQNVKLFVSEADYDEYAAKVDSSLLSSIEIGGEGLAAQRNAIARHYLEGEHVVQCDDDLRDVLRKVDDKTLEPIDNLWKFFAEAEQWLDQAHARLWGIYPVANPMFMKNSITTDLRFCIGQMFGVRNTHAEWAMVENSQKEDYERTLRFFEQQGFVVRFNFVAVKSPMYGPGGMQAEDQPDRQAANRTAVRYLMERWPRHVKLAKRRSKVGLEVRLKQ